MTATITKIPTVTPIASPTLESVEVVGAEVLVGLTVAVPLMVEVERRVLETVSGR